MVVGPTDQQSVVGINNIIVITNTNILFRTVTAILMLTPNLQRCWSALDNLSLYSRKVLGAIHEA